SRVRQLRDGRHVVRSHAGDAPITAKRGSGWRRSIPQAPTHAGPPARVFQRAGVPTEGRIELRQRFCKMYSRSVGCQSTTGARYSMSAETKVGVSSVLMQSTRL